MAIRIGAIGLGDLGRLQSEVCDKLDDVKIVCGADIDIESREVFETDFEAPTYEDHESLLEAHAHELDAAIIVTPHTLHFEQTMACLKAGLHVHLEKPMVTTTADALEMLDYVRKTDQVLQIGYQRHFHPAYQEIKRIIDSGRIGQVHMASCYLAQDWIGPQAGTWRTNPALSGGGQLIDSGSHLLDVLLWTTDSEPREVTALTDSWDQEVDVNSALSVRLDGPERSIIASVGISGDGSSFEEHIALWGTKGRIVYEDGKLLVDEDGTEYVSKFNDPAYQTLTKLKFEAFFDAIRTNKEPQIPGEFGLKVTRLTEAAFRSVDTKRTVDAKELPLKKDTNEQKTTV
jgi:predicted dehydrogenase